MQKPTIGSLARSSATRFGDLPFLVQEDESVSFAEFDERVDQLCAGLLRLGLRRGDHVAIWLPNTIEWVVCFAACGRIGAVAVPVNTRYRMDEARYVIERSDATALVMLPSMWRNNYYDMLVEMAPSLPQQVSGSLELPEFPRLKSVILLSDEKLPGTVRYRDVTEGDVGTVRAAEAEVRPEDLLLVSFTSGTTGKPKGVMHHHGVIEQSTRVGIALNGEPGDRILGHMPFYHSAGLFMAIIPAMSLGLTLYPMVEWDASKALRLIEKHHVNLLGGIPTHFFDAVEILRKEKINVSSIKSAWIGGSAVVREAFDDIKSVMGIDRLLSTYGMTENTISTSFNAWDDPSEVCCRNSAPILSSCEVRIVDPKTFEDRPVGQDGEVVCRGETVMIGYYKDDDATRAVITEDGWLRSGDLGNIDENGYLTITGRIKDMLKVGGSNTSPLEIEEVLAAYPGVKASIVVGVPDQRLGEVVFAFVIPDPESTPSAGSLIDHCKSKLANYKVPRHVEFVTEFPRTATGKIQRAVLTEEASQIVGTHA